MKISEKWLREWVNPPVDTNTLAEQLTMAGLEVDAVEPAAPAFSGVVVAQVLACEQHPQADKLKVCQVDDGSGDHKTVVCGAPNVREGVRVPFAQVGARLPGDVKIGKAKLRGVASFGMLCSAKELGLSDDAGGLWLLPEEAPVGADLRDWLALDDAIIDVDLTPNRADCLGIRGVAREVAALNGLPFEEPEYPPVKPECDAVIPVDIQAANGCGRYIGRVIRGIDPNAVTPMWMQERLRRSGIRAIHPVVDVTNYVLLELGHPMHGFDLRSIRERVVVRWANEGEKLTLLDGRTVDLQDDCLLIADAEKPLALAGIMGGEHSGVADDTVDVFLESAWFNPLSIAGRARRFGLHTDASHRYERGVDPALQQKAMERATALLLDIAGGKPGPLMVAEAAEALPARQRIVLTRKRLERVLGVSIEQDTITSILLSLGMELEQREPDTWLVLPPSFRFDIAIEEDLIEEVARLYGYDRIEVGVPEAPLTMVACPESKVKDGEIKRLLVAKGLREVITYSFVDRSKEKRVAPDIEPKSLVNPISSEMSVMRTSLWQGLLQVAGYNLRHQVPRVRIFEKGLVFVPGERGLEQPCKWAGVLAGARDVEPVHGQDGVDFFDAKGVVEAVFRRLQLQPEFERAEHPALHPGQSARVRLNGQAVGWVGTVHPSVAAAFDIKSRVVVWEIDAQAWQSEPVPSAQEVSRFPTSQRDIAVVVDEDVEVGRLMELIEEAGAEFLQNVRLFDIYQGKGIDSGRKSVALGLIFGASSRTLTDSEVNEQVEAILAKLAESVGATLRT